QGGFDRGIGRAIERLLVSPAFLFRIEGDQARTAAGLVRVNASDSPAVRRISDIELASRLSFFLWSSIPDDELLDVATRGGLKDPATLERQALRMLADPRSD